MLENLAKGRTTTEPFKFEKPISEYYVEPHTGKSRMVELEDMPRVLKDAQMMQALCTASIGKYNGAIAIAHSQITKKDPLRFFVTKTGIIFINPVIFSHTKYLIWDFEGCTSFPFKDRIRVGRYNKCDIRFSTLDNEGQFVEQSLKVSGVDARMFQHELGHMNAELIYPIK
jgi:peptide deformylase